jgi:hypothetical protein
MARANVTLETLDARFAKLEQLIERGFAATAADIADTKDQLIALHVQVNSIERQLGGLVKLESRVADLEEEIFGEVRT